MNKFESKFLYLAILIRPRVCCGRCRCCCPWLCLISPPWPSYSLGRVQYSLSLGYSIFALTSSFASQFLLFLEFLNFWLESLVINSSHIVVIQTSANLPGWIFMPELSSLKIFIFQMLLVWIHLLPLLYFSSLGYYVMRNTGKCRLNRARICGKQSDTICTFVVV